MFCSKTGEHGGHGNASGGTVTERPGLCPRGSCPPGGILLLSDEIWASEERKAQMAVSRGGRGCSWSQICFSLKNKKQNQRHFPGPLSHRAKCPSTPISPPARASQGTLGPAAAARTPLHVAKGEALLSHVAWVPFWIVPHLSRPPDVFLLSVQIPPVTATKPPSSVQQICTRLLRCQGVLGACEVASERGPCSLFPGSWTPHQAGGKGTPQREHVSVPVRLGRKRRH